MYLNLKYRERKIFKGKFFQLSMTTRIFAKITDTLNVELF